MRDTAPQATRLRDYRPPAYLVDRVEITLYLRPAATEVHSLLHYRANPSVPSRQTFVLQGEQHQNVGLKLDGAPLSADRYELDEQTLAIFDPPGTGILEVRSTITPESNTALLGLFLSGGCFCTQCEAQGFRRITYFPDRPDVLAKFTTRLIADKAAYPILLSNGNLTERGDWGETEHFALWEDPYPKPCYLFAVVAGELAALEDVFVTQSGRSVALSIYSTRQNLSRCAHAMNSLKRAMRWDEVRFGREYDLETFMIFCADDFNMGAMENKGLNIFNSKYLLARYDTATDDDFEAVEAVIGHEYFHNWTGNRITCRDWFQLALKEGLTVFREQEFSSDMGSRACQRIAAVNFLRAYQFPEDAGPMAHPVRPDSYAEIENFYTATVYEKGAELIRMLHTLLGAAEFRRGMDLYFARHDGQAVTCEAFVQAIEDSSGVDLKQFRRWFSQAGTPVLSIHDSYDAHSQTYTLYVHQSCSPTPGQPHKRPLHIPIAVSLFSRSGKPLGLSGKDGELDSRVLSLTRAKQEFHFRGVAARPIPSLLRGFSAPVKLEVQYSAEDLAFLIGHDTDPVNRWNAAQTLWLRALDTLVALHCSGEPLVLDVLVIDACRAALLDASADPALRAQTMTLPDLKLIAEQQVMIDVEATQTARAFLRRGLAKALRNDFLSVYEGNCSDGEYEPTAPSTGRRALRNLALNYLAANDGREERKLCMQQFRSAKNMTDELGALTALNDSSGAERCDAMAYFRQKWQGEPLVLDKWLALQAMSALPDTLLTVRDLLVDPQFDRHNPNRVRALLGTFALRNWQHFHGSSGEAYEFIASQVVVLDRLNPHVSSRIARAFDRWRKFDPVRQHLQHQALERIASTPGLSPNLGEIVAKSLDAF